MRDTIVATHSSFAADNDSLTLDAYRVYVLFNIESTVHLFTDSFYSFENFVHLFVAIFRLQIFHPEIFMVARHYTICLC